MTGYTWYRILEARDCAAIMTAWRVIFFTSLKCRSGVLEYLSTLEIGQVTQPTSNLDWNTVNWDTHCLLVCTTCASTQMHTPKNIPTYMNIIKKRTLVHTSKQWVSIDVWLTTSQKPEYSSSHYWVCMCILYNQLQTWTGILSIEIPIDYLCALHTVCKHTNAHT